MKVCDPSIATLSKDTDAAITLVDRLWANNWLSFSQREQIRDQFFDEIWNETPNKSLFAKLTKLQDDINTMPNVAAKARLRDSDMAYLHYNRGETHWYITSKPSIHAESNAQVFGLAVRDMGRSIISGSIDLGHLIDDDCPAELDLFWFVQSIGNIRACALDLRKTCTSDKSALRMLTYRGREYPVIHESAQQRLDDQAIFVCNDKEWLMSDSKLLKQLVQTGVIV